MLSHCCFVRQNKCGSWRVISSRHTLTQPGTAVPATQRPKQPLAEPNALPVQQASFPAQRSDTDPQTTKLWHSRMGNPGNEALSRLRAATIGVPQFVVDTDICEVCPLSKATQQISRSPEKEDHQNTPFHRVSCDFIQFEEGYNGDEYIAHFEDFSTGFNIVFSCPQRRGFADILREFLNLVRTRYNRTVRILRMDNETAAVDSADFEELRIDRDLTVEFSAPRTPAQNGHSERFGRSIIKKARSLRLDANLPASLWPEMARTASHLLNRTPSRKLGWKTPLEALTGQKPALQHLRLIGSKAFVLRHDIPKKNELEARSLVEYLVEFDSRRIWRIWHPARKIVRSRDVTFDETQRFDPNQTDTLGAISTANRDIESDDEEDPDTIVVRRTAPPLSQQTTQLSHSETSKITDSTPLQLRTPTPTPEPDTRLAASGSDAAAPDLPESTPSPTSGGIGRSAAASTKYCTSQRSTRSA